MPIDRFGQYIREESVEETISNSEELSLPETQQGLTPKPSVKLSDKNKVKEATLEKRREVMKLLQGKAIEPQT